MKKSHLFTLLFFSLPLLHYFSLPIHFQDLAVWLSQGNWMLEHGKILRADPYSFIPTRPLVYPVLPCLIYATIAKSFGLFGVQLFHKIALLGVYGLIYIGSIKKMKAPWSTPTLLLSFITMTGLGLFSVDRPALLAFIPALLTFQILLKPTLKARDFLALGTILLIWVNLHGSWPLLIVLFAWKTLLERNGKLFSIGMPVLFVITLLNPFGAEIYPYILQTIQMSQERNISEWSSTFKFFAPIESTLYLTIFLAVATAGFISFRTNRIRFNKIIQSPFIPGLFMGLTSIRNTGWTFLFLLPFIVSLNVLPETNREESSGSHQKILNGFIAALILFLLYALSPWQKNNFLYLLPEGKRTLFDSDTPLETVKALDQLPNGRVFNEFEFGSYLTLVQSKPIYIDTRNIIYSADAFSDYESVIAGNNWEKTLNHYQIDYLLIHKNRHPALKVALQNSIQWIKVSEDQNAFLWMKRKVF